MGLTKNYKKAVNAVVFSEKTERFRITYKEVVENEVIAFVSLKKFESN